MKTRLVLSSVAAGLLLALPVAAKDKEKPEPPKITVPDAGVPQIMMLEGRFVRVAYNNEGYAVLGYRVANLSVGEKWMLLDIGLTVRDKVPEYTMGRDSIAITTPDGKSIPMASNEEFRTAPLEALDRRARIQSDSINYFPPQATVGCRIGFFADIDQVGQSFDQVTLNSQRGCMGRIFFHIPDGIARGQHWLDVQFDKSVVRVPFRIFTDEEYKLLDKNYKNIEQQVKDAFKPKG